MWGERRKRRRARAGIEKSETYDARYRVASISLVAWHLTVLNKQTLRDITHIPRRVRIRRRDGRVRGGGGRRTDRYASPLEVFITSPVRCTVIGQSSIVVVVALRRVSEFPDAKSLIKSHALVARRTQSIAESRSERAKNVVVYVHIYHCLLTVVCTC